MALAHERDMAGLQDARMRLTVALFRGLINEKGEC
jgi:hypothetical protein